MATLAVETPIPAATPNSSLLGTSTRGIFFCFANKGRCITISFGLTSTAIKTSFACPLSTAFVTSLTPFLILPVVLATSTASKALSANSSDM